MDKYKAWMIVISILMIGSLCNVYGKSNADLKKKKPNVIFILTDDQGNKDLGCYGSEDILTPNLDKLAENGTRFTQLYATSSACSPSRASIMTGKNPHASHLGQNASPKNKHAGMPSDQITIAENFKEAGYSTAHIGKWHLGHSKDTRPLGQGFDYSFGHMVGCIDNYSHFFYWNGANRHDLWENDKEVFFDGKYFPALMVDKAKTFIDKNENQSFFMYFAMNTPHYPLQPAQKWRNHYKNLEMPRRDYAAFTSTADEYIGNLINYLEDKDILDNTIIVYMSDHGHSSEERNFGEAGSAGIYRGCKFSLFEGGIRVPSIISWKNHLPVGKVNDEFLISVDWMPTLMDLCDIKKTSNKIEGRSMVPVITKGKKSTHDVFYWKLGNQWMVREGNWKLIGNPQDATNKYKLDKEKDALFLTNLEQDITEATNLANQYPKIVKKMLKMYKGWEYSETKDYLNL